MHISSHSNTTHLQHGSDYTCGWIWVIVCGCIVFLGLMLFRQPLYPVPWFDEGLNVSTAATFSRDGVYALPDSTGDRVFDPAIQTGPTVIVPIALVYRFFGANIVYARLVLLVFVGLALAAYALLAQRLIGERAMLLAVLFLLVGNSEPFASFISVGCQVLGEVPALAYVLIGILIWLPVLEQRTHVWARLLLSGLAWGIAMVTKSQVLLLLPICLAALALLNYTYYRVAGWQAFIVPGCVGLMCVAIWYGTQIWIAGLAQFQQNAAVLHEGFALHIVGVDIQHWRNALSVIWRSMWWLWGAPGLIWGIWQARRRTAQGFSHAMALALPLIGLLWFSLLSIGWSRYAFYTFALTPLWTAGLLYEIWLGSVTLAHWKGRQLLVGGCVMCILIGNGWSFANQLLHPYDSGYLALQDYLATHVSPTATIETWEWELDPGATQAMHHPSTTIANVFTAALWTHEGIPNKLYDPLLYHTDYLVQGPFSSWTGISRGDSTRC